MDSPLGPALANAFLCFYEKKWLEQCPDKFTPAYYRRLLVHFCNITFNYIKPPHTYVTQTLSSIQPTLCPPMG